MTTPPPRAAESIWGHEVLKIGDLVQTRAIVERSPSLDGVPIDGSSLLWCTGCGDIVGPATRRSGCACGNVTVVDGMSGVCRPGEAMILVTRPRRAAAT